MASRPPEEPGVELSTSASADPRWRLLADTLGSQYEILRLLGQGGAGTVYLARERLLERLVAIKMLRSEFVSADSRERFVREARTAAKLMHPGIVPLYSFGQAGDTLFYIMGFVEGESLGSMLTRVGRCDSNEARRILVEVADALNYAHRNGVVHRDVKPDNILLDRDSGRAILTDFGIAKQAAMQSTLTATGIIVGTPLYMSPEQAAGDPQIDGRSDLYSVGVIGYRMLAGRLPFEGSSAQDVMMKHVTQEPAPLAAVAPNAPIDLAWAISRCLDKDPMRRWPTAEAFRQALEAGEGSIVELPEPLEHLSGSAVRALGAAWWLGLVAAAAWARTGKMMWIAAALAMPMLAIAFLTPRYRNAKRFGLTRDRIWRLLGAPPERWTGWWPASLRRAGDVWSELPTSLRRSRAARSASLWGLLGIGVPALVLSGVVAARLGRQPVFASTVAIVGGSILAAAIVFFVIRAAAVNELAAKRVNARLIRKCMVEPTWGSAFWRRPEMATVLLEPARASKPIDSETEDTYCVSTPIQTELPQGMFDHVDPRSPTPLYAQIASRLRVAIASGELRPGDSLPSVRQLSSRLRINPATVVQAYRELEDEGLVNTRHGAGTFVQDVAVDRRSRDREKEALRLVRDLLAEAGSLGITVSELRAAMDQELKSGAAR